VLRVEIAAAFQLVVVDKGIENGRQRSGYRAGQGQDVHTSYREHQLPCRGGGTAHIIPAVTNEGTPPLISYRRVILHVVGLAEGAKPQ